MRECPHSGDDDDLAHFSFQTLSKYCSLHQEIYQTLKVKNLSCPRSGWKSYAHGERVMSLDLLPAFPCKQPLERHYLLLFWARSARQNIPRLGKACLRKL